MVVCRERMRKAEFVDGERAAVKHSNYCSCFPSIGDRMASEPGGNPSGRGEQVDPFSFGSLGWRRSLIEDELARLKTALAARYEFDRELGQGAFATVFLARDLQLERQVAIKVLHPRPESPLNDLRFVQEIHFLARLQHPNILPIHDSGHVGELLYYVMPYVEGESLRARLVREQVLAVREAIRIARALTDALDCAHRAHVIHRDIKPENILLSDSIPILADFGIARALDVSRAQRITSTGVGSPGTPPYMSPEQLAGSPGADVRSDIYSLGCVLYEMLTGHAPFDEDGGFAKRVTDPPPSARERRPEVTLALDRVLAKALGRTPEERFTSARAMRDALDGAVKNPLSEALSEADAQALTEAPWYRQPKYTLLATAVAAVIIAVTMAASAIRGTRNSAATGHLDDLRRIAVLYFDDLTPDRHLPDVANGLTENLIDQLSQVSSLRVISPNGVRQFRGTTAPVDSVSRQLNAGTIVGGSVSSSGATMRLTVRLIDGKTGEEFHNRTFQRPSWDFFKLQDSLSFDVAVALRERLGREIRLREQRSAASSLEAWKLVEHAEEMTEEGAARLRSGDMMARRTLFRADSAYALAEKADPKWVTPTVDRARTALIAAFLHSESPDSTRITLEEAVSHAERAIRKNQHSAEAFAIRGEARLRMVTFGAAEDQNTDSILSLAQRDLTQAASARPDQARTWSVLGDLYFEQGSYDEAAEAYKTAYDTDAFLDESRSITQMLVMSSLSGGRFEDARNWCSVARHRFPEDPRFRECTLLILGWSAQSKGEIATAWDEVSSIEKGDSAGILTFNRMFRRVMVAAVAARSGMPDSARAIIARALHEGGPEQPALAAEAYVHVLLGEPTAAIVLLRRLVKTSPRVRGKLRNNPWFKGLRDEPAFRELVLA